VVDEDARERTIVGALAAGLAVYLYFSRKERKRSCRSECLQSAGS
jgi:hypothetical protein